MYRTSASVHFNHQPPPETCCSVEDRTYPSHEVSEWKTSVLFDDIHSLDHLTSLAIRSQYLEGASYPTFSSSYLRPTSCNDIGAPLYFSGPDFHSPWLYSSFSFIGV